MLLALSIVGTLVAVLVAVAWPGVFGAEVGGERGVLLLGLLAVPATNLLTLLTNAFAAVQRPIVSSVLMLAQFVTIAAGASVGVIVAGLEGYFAGTAAASFVVLVGGIVALRRLEGGSRPHRRTRVLAELRRHPDLLRFAAVQGILIITTPAAYLIARYAILEEGGLAEAGILAAAFALANVVTAALMPATRLVLVPAMNRRAAATEKLRQALRFRDAFMLFAGILGLPLVLFPGTALELFFADGFREAESVLWIFIVAQVALGLGSINQGLLVGLDDYASTVVTVVAGQALMVVLTLSLVPSMGVAAVGLALLADYALVLWWTGWRLWRRHRMPIFKGLPTYSLVLLAAVAGLGALVPELPGSSPSLVAGKLALLVAFTLGAVAMARRMRLHVPMPAPAAT
jgi:O-antigen/teichoic acid export membrane protein